MAPTKQRALNSAERITVPAAQDTSTKKQIAKASDGVQAQVANASHHTEAYQANWIEGSYELAFLGTVVHEWIKRCQSSGMVVTDNLITNIGLKVSQLTKYKEFRATSHWLARFKSKYKLSSEDLLNPTPKQADKGDLNEKSLVLKQIIADLKSKGISGKKHSVSKWNKTNGRTKYGKSQLKGGQELNGESHEEVLDDEKLDMIKPIADTNLDNSRNNNTVDNNGQTFLENTEYIPQDIYAGVNDVCAKQIESYKQALNHLGPLEQFLLMQEDIRAIGLVNQLENMFRERIN